MNAMLNNDERYMPNFVAVPADRYERLIKAEAMLTAMLAEYDRNKYRIIGGETISNAKAVVYGDYGEEKEDA